MRAASPAVRHAIVVPGEAPETDDDEEEASPPCAPTQRHKMSQRSDSEPVPSTPGGRVQTLPKYNSILHKKLRENQQKLEADVSAFTSRQCLSMAKDLGQVAQGIANTQLTVQDASYKLRYVTDALYKVEREINTVLSLATLLPAVSVNDFPAINGQIEPN